VCFRGLENLQRPEMKSYFEQYCRDQYGFIAKDDICLLINCLVMRYRENCVCFARPYITRFVISLFKFNQQIKLLSWHCWE